MNYLFFDIETIMAESINPRIVSFGYVLTDERFNEITKEDIFINPQEETETTNNWQWKQDATKDKEGFKAFYHKIKGLLESKDTVIIGHGTGNDVQYLFDECDRFHFEPIDFEYLDTKAIADLLLDADMSKNLKSLYDNLCENRRDYRWHRSLDDACMTKAVFEALLDRATKDNVNIMDNEDLVFNSLRCVYGELADVAKRSEEAFSCNFDVPIIGILVQCNYVNGTENKKEKIHLYYDYAVDRFFAPKHPKKGSPKENSILPDNAYEIAKRRAVYKVNKMWNDAKSRNTRKNFFHREGYLLTDIKIKHIYYSVTSYEVYATFKNDFLAFDFKIPISGHYLKNAIGSKKDTIIDMKHIIKKIHTAETANKSLLLMAKMKFGYKDKTFPKVQIQDLPYSENVSYLLAKEYANMLKDPNAHKELNDTLINRDKIYIPTEHAFENNLYSEQLTLPVLSEKIDNRL